MANALKWIIAEAKRLRRKNPHRFDSLANPWRDGFVAQASAIYASKHKGRSPVGKKKHRPHKKKTAHRRTGSVRTTSRSHTDKNKITANIQVGALGKVGAGTLEAELRRRKKEKIDYLVLRRYHATRARDKKKISKQISQVRRELARLG